MWREINPQAIVSVGITERYVQNILDVRSLGLLKVMYGGIEGFIVSE